MSRQLSFILSVFIFSMALLGVVMAPKASLLAQEPPGPALPVCSAGSQEVLRFGEDGTSLLRRPDMLDANFSFNVPAGAGPEGQVLVWQGVGHQWDAGCSEGDNNDGGRFPCDQTHQEHEIIKFSLNGVLVGQFVDNGTDLNTHYDFPLANLEAGSNALVLDHLNAGDNANSVFYKGVVCAVTAATATPTSTSTPTNTPTDTPTNTPTSTSTPTNTPTSTSTNTPTNTPTSTPTNTPVSEGPTATSTPTPTNTPETSGPENPPSPTPTVTATATATEEDSGPTALDPVDQPSQPGLLEQVCSTGICQFLPFVRP